MSKTILGLDSASLPQATRTLPNPQDCQRRGGRQRTAPPAFPARCAVRRFVASYATPRNAVSWQLSAITATNTAKEWMSRVSTTPTGKG